MPPARRTPRRRPPPRRTPLALLRLEERDVPAFFSGAPDEFDIPDHDYAVPATAVRFVAPNGSATATGTSRTAPTTVARAVQLAAAGETIVFLAGEYRGVNNVAVNKRLTFQPEGSAEVWLKGSEVVPASAFVRDGTANRWVFSYTGDRFEFAPDPNEVVGQNPLADDREMVFVTDAARTNRSLRQVATAAEVTAGTFAIDRAANRIVLGEDPAGKTIEITSVGRAFNVVAQNVVVRGLGFTHFGGTSILAFSQTGSAGLTLERNAFVWNAREGATVRSNAGRLAGNLFAANGQQGLAGGGTGQLVENNRFAFNNVEGYSSGGQASGAKFFQTDGLVVRNNLAEDNFTKGFWIDGDLTVRTAFVGNTVRNNMSRGIHVEISTDTVVAFNLIYGNGTDGIGVMNSQGTRIYNNTLVDNGTDLSIETSDRIDDVEPGLGMTYPVRDNRVFNNIFSGADDAALFDASRYDVDFPTPPPAIPSATRVAASDHNAYHRLAANDPPALIKWRDAGGVERNYANLNAFRAAVPGYEVNSVERTGADPFFVDKAGGDYRLRANSVAVGRGTAIPADIADLARAAGIPVPANDVVGYLGALAPVSPPPPPPPPVVLPGGGFESPDLGPGGLAYPTANGGAWVYMLNPGVAGSGVAANGSAFGQPNAPGGDQAAFVQGAASLTSAAPVQLAPGTYRVTFQAAQWAGNGGSGPQRLGVRLAGPGGSSQTVVVTPAGTGFATSTADFTVSAAGGYTLGFVGQNPSAGSVAFLDEVGLAPLSTSPPPPPPPPPAGLQGGGFEAPDLGPGGLAYPTANGGAWVYVLNPGVAGSGIAANGSAFGQPNAPEGDQAAFVQGPATLTSAAPVQLSPGTYRVTFRAAQWAGNGGSGPQRLAVRLTGPGGFSQTVVVTPAGTGYATSTADFTVTAAGGYTAGFLGQNPSAGSVAFLDDILLTRIS